MAHQLLAIQAWDLENDQALLNGRLDRFFVARRAGEFERDATKDLAHHPYLICLNVADFAVEVGGFFRKVQIAMLHMIECNALLPAVGVVIEFGMVGGKRMNLLTVTCLASCGSHLF